MSSSANLDNVLNFRDVGKTVNEYLGQKLILYLPFKYEVLTVAGVFEKAYSIALPA
jgi:hypothetical protein